MRINIVTIFPDFFEAPLATSIPGRASEKGLADYRILNLREFTHDRHQTVDDTFALWKYRKQFLRHPSHPPCLSLPIPPKGIIPQSALPSIPPYFSFRAQEF